jgi:hypothetical protein
VLASGDKVAEFASTATAKDLTISKLMNENLFDAESEKILKCENCPTGRSETFFNENLFDGGGGKIVFSCEFLP